MGRLDQSIQQSESETPLVLDRSGRLFETVLEGSVGLVKRFDPPADPEAAARLHQRLWRLARLQRPELGDMGLQADATGLRCVLTLPEAPRLTERLPLAEEAAARVLAQLMAFTWTCHQARVSGLRFQPDALAWHDQAGVRWLAPDLVVSAEDEEQERRADLVALAGLGQTLAGEMPAADTRLGQALELLATPRNATIALQAALTGLAPDLALELRLPTGGDIDREWLMDELTGRLDAMAATPRAETLWITSDEGARVGPWWATAGDALADRGVASYAGVCRPNGAPLHPLRPTVLALLERLPEDVSLQEGPLAPLTHWLTPHAPAPLPVLPPTLAKIRLFQAIALLLGEATAGGPLAVLLRDYQHLDEVTRDFFEFLRHQAAGLPILWVFESDTTTRLPQPALHWPALSPAEVGALMRALCPGRTWTQAAVEEAWKVSEGVPERVARHCAGLLTGHPHTGVPGGEVCEAIAVAGGFLPLSQLPGSARAPEVTFEAVEAALEAGWLNQEADGLSFALPTEAADCLARLSPEAVVEWHQSLCAEISPGSEAAVLRRAEHALQTLDDALAALLALAAARQLRLRGAVETAELWLDAGLGRLSAEEPRRAAFQVELAALSLAAHDPAPAEAHLKAALAQPEHVPDLMGAWRLLGRAHRMAGEYALARQALEQALTLDQAPPRARGEEVRKVPPAIGAPARGGLLVELANVHMDLGEFREGRAMAEEALELARRSDDPVLKVEATLAVGRSMLLEGGVALLHGEPLLYEVIAEGEAIGHLEAVSLAYHWIAHLQLAEGQLEPALGNLLHHQAKCRILNRTDDYLRGTLDVAWTTLQIGYFESALLEVEHLEASLDEVRTPELLVQAMTIRAVALMVLGYLHDPLRLLDQAQRLARKLDDGQLELVALGHLVFALLFLGKYPRAMEVCEAALARASRFEARAETLRLRLMQSEILWRQNDLDAAEAIAQEVLRHEDEDVTGIVRAEAQLSLARVYLSRGDLDQARDLAQLAFGLVQDAGYLLLRAELCCMLGDLAWHERSLEVATNYFEMAIAVADLMNSPHHRAIALEGMARCAAEAADATSLRARAAENLNVYLEQLSDLNKRDFLNWPERQQVLHPTAEPLFPEAVHATRPPGRPAARTTEPTLGILDEVMGLVASKLPLEELLARLNEIFHRLTHASRAMIFLINEDGELKLRDRQVSQDKLSVLSQDTACEAALARVRHTGQTLWVQDTSRAPDYAELPEVKQLGLRGLLAVPLKVTDGDGERVIGCFYGDSQAAWTSLSSGEIATLEMVARYTGVLLEVGLLQEESTRKAHRLEILNQLSRALAGTLDLDQLLNLALGRILAITQGEQGYVFFGDDLDCRASLDHQGQAISEIQVSRSVIARVQRDRLPLAILDIGQDEELQSKASIMIRNIRSVMCVPLILDDHLVGMIYISSATANKTFTRHDLDLLTAVSAQVALALQNAQAFETIKELNQGLEEKVRERTSELTKAYQELSETQNQLLDAEKLATIGTLAGGVAHEINNPLGAILTNAQLLLLDIEDEEQRDSLSLIEEGAKRCQQIVSALLQYSKLAKNSHEPVELRDLVQEALTLFEAQTNEARIKVMADLTFVPSIMGDPVELRQVLAHLFFNAIDAIQEHHAGKGGCLQVRLARCLAGVELSIQDDGVGMPPEITKRVFDPFFTTKKVGSGQGLGLAVCLKIVEKHGGKITVQSKPAEGATFTVVLPVP